MTDLLVVLAVAVGSYALRTSFIVVAGQRTASPAIVAILDHVKPAALAALAVTAASSHETLTPAHAAALVVAGFAAYKGAGLLTALILGMLALAAGSLII